MSFTKTIALMALVTTVVFAQPNPTANLSSGKTIARIEQNILANLDSDILEIRASTIQTIIELTKVRPQLDLDYTVFPLMRILKSSDTPELRILSALALYHLDTETGKFAVARRSIYDNSERVSKMCQRISNAWDNTGTEEFHFASTPAAHN